jgi:hypothetical protein
MRCCKIYIGRSDNLAYFNFVCILPNWILSAFLKKNLLQIYNNITG